MTQRGVDEERMKGEKLKIVNRSVWNSLPQIAPGSSFSSKFGEVLFLMSGIQPIHFKQHIYKDEKKMIDMFKATMSENKLEKEETKAIARYLHLFSRGQISALSAALKLNKDLYTKPEDLPASTSDIAEIFNEPPPKQLPQSSRDSDDEYSCDFIIKKCKKKSFYERQKSKATVTINIGHALLVTLFFDADSLDEKNLELLPRYFVVYESFSDEDDEVTIVFEGFRNFYENNQGIAGMKKKMDELKKKKDSFKLFPFDDIVGKFSPYLKDSKNAAKFEKLRNLYRPMVSADHRVFQSSATKFGDLPENHRWTQKGFKTAMEKSVEWYQQHILGGKRFMTMGTERTTVEKQNDRLKELEDFEVAAEPIAKKKKTLPRE
ncbi:Oidioi.mRNA.OKI2018_I69.XSR.g16986.t1.cds [Oikopleura dioica]|uniref:Oidioi.mRNA.OKI2018_I69.XSR.g16986.t1.cds n=1 Tax=Oikopleura dioica TaxID=34765 RepID=A0ABN7SS58_OIKDI|nr:Oidioi.mRNA.OKI2018_I69.XSR.g16986.t1.cds [Oikopleura dioica]